MPSSALLRFFMLLCSPPRPQSVRAPSRLLTLCVASLWLLFASPLAHAEEPQTPNQSSETHAGNAHADDAHADDAHADDAHGGDNPHDAHAGDAHGGDKAHNDKPHSEENQGLRNIVLMSLLLGFGYFITHILVNYFERRLFVASGLEYILLGVFLNWTFDYLNFDTAGNLQAFAPIISLGLGSIGLSVGLQAHRKRKPRIDWEAIRGASWTATLTFLFVVLGFLFWLYLYRGSISFELLSRRDVLAAMLIIGSAAIVSASELITHIVVTSGAQRGFISRFAINTAWLSEAFGIIAFGTVFCVAHVGATTLPREPTIFEWFGINLALGVSLGAIFSLFLGRTVDDDRLFVALLGIVVFASGLASYLQLSPIFINFVVGVLLAQRDQTCRALHTKLQSIEKPAYIVLFIFAGMLWQAPTLVGWLLIPLYVGLRVVGKTAGGWLTYRNSRYPDRYVKGVGLTLVAQGGLAMAMAFNYRQVYQGSELTNTIFNCLIVGIILNELFAPRTLQSLLVEADEIPLESTGFVQLHQGLKHWEDVVEDDVDPIPHIAVVDAIMEPAMRSPHISADEQVSELDASARSPALDSSPLTLDDDDAMPLDGVEPLLPTHVPVRPPKTAQALGEASETVTEPLSDAKPPSPDSSEELADPTDANKDRS